MYVSLFSFHVFTLSRGYLFTIQLQIFSFCLEGAMAWLALASQIFQFSGVASMLLSMSFCVTEKYLLIVKTDQHKDGCYFQHIVLVGRTSRVSLLIVFVWCEHL